MGPEAKCLPPMNWFWFCYHFWGLAEEHVCGDWLALATSAYSLGPTPCRVAEWARNHPKPASNGSEHQAKHFAIPLCRDVGYAKGTHGAFTSVHAPVETGGGGLCRHNATDSTGYAVTAWVDICVSSVIAVFGSECVGVNGASWVSRCVGRYTRSGLQ